MDPLNGITSDIDRKAIRGDEDAQEETSRRLAALTVRRECDQHSGGKGCTPETCTHPNHRRDADYTLTMLDMIGLDAPLPVASEDDRQQNGSESGLSEPLPDSN